MSARVGFRTMRLMVVVGLTNQIAACGPVDDEATPDLVVTTPQALTVACANAPADLKAELTVSGNRDPCPLDVNDDGSTSGSCKTTKGIVRFVTLDWFVIRPSALGTDTRVVLAQARKEVDLRDDPEGETAVSFSDDDIVVRGCVDVRNDAVDGELLQDVDGTSHEVCDLDSSCLDVNDVACSNLAELCDGTDPLSP